MRRMLLFGSGLAVGYVLGAKAGRERYDEILAFAGSVTDRAPRSITDAATTASRRAEDLTETARDKAHEVVDLADRKVDEAADAADEAVRKAEGRLSR